MIPESTAAGAQASAAAASTPEGVPAARQPKRTFTLVNGVTVAMYRGKGYDFVKAQQASADMGQLAYIVAYLSRVCTFDGVPLPFEAILGWDGDPFLELIDKGVDGGAFLSGAGLSSAPPPISPAASPARPI